MFLSCIEKLAVTGTLMLDWHFTFTVLLYFLSFVLKWCDRGRGLKPDWAVKGMDFLIFAANPEITKYISDDDFEVKSLIQK